MCYVVVVVVVVVAWITFKRLEMWKNYLSTTSFYMHLQFLSVTEMLSSLFVCAVARLHNK